MRTTQAIGSSPFEPITDFRQFATDPTARVKLKDLQMSEPNTFDLIRAINTTHAAHEAFVSVRGAVVVGGDPIPLLADANARCQDLVTAVEGLQDYLLAAIRERGARTPDDAAMSHVEGLSNDPGQAGKAIAAALGIDHVQRAKTLREAAE